MRQRRHILDHPNRNSGSLQPGDRTLATRTRPFDTDFHFPHSELLGAVCANFSGSLCSKRSAFSAPLEPNGSSCRPAQNLSIGIGNGDQCVIEGRLDVRNRLGNVTPDLFLLLLCHKNPSVARSLSGAPCCLTSFVFAIPSRLPTGERPPGQSLPDQCFISLTPFFPATVLRTPLRVRALVLVLCPRTGRPRRCRIPR